LDKLRARASNPSSRLLAPTKIQCPALTTCKT
jgi:hypothetical protein